MRLPVSSFAAAISAPLLLLTLATACGQAPVPVGEEQQQRVSEPPSEYSDAETLPDGHPTGMTHPGLANGGAGDTTFTGAVRLEGDLAQRTGFVFVNVKPKGARMPCYSRKFRLDATSDPSITEAEGALLVDFVLDKNYELGGLVDGELVIEAVFDPDGYVDTKEPERVVQVSSVEPGESGIALTLTR